MKKDLSEKETDLKDIVKANAKEETKLTGERKKLEAEVKKADLSDLTSRIDQNVRRFLSERE